MRVPCLLVALSLVACGDEAAEPPGTGGGGAAPLACGATEVPFDGTCVNVGVPPEACGEGMAPDGRGGCEVVLPAEECAPGEVALPGETRCRPLSSCTGTRWGRAPIDADTEFVDASFMGVSDGSEAAPWRTLGEATSMATPGAVVAIAAGTYEESVWVFDALRLWGSCATEVTIAGPAGDAALVLLHEGIEAHDLGVSGLGDGIVVSAPSVTLEGVWAHDTENFVGIAVIDANGPASLVLRDALVENARSAGVLAAGSHLTLERTVVRAGRPDAFGRAGAGVALIVSPENDIGSQLAMDRCLVEDVRGSGISLEGSVGTITQTVVRDVLPQEVDGTDGEGIIAVRSAATGLPSQLTLTRSLIARVHEAGVIAVHSNATVSDVTVRDVAAQVASPPNGIGIVGQGSTSIVSIERTLVERSVTANLLLLSAQASARHTILRESTDSDGLVVFADSEAASATVSLTRIERHPRAGASTFGGTFSFEATLFECNLFHLAIEPWNGLAGAGEDLGQNHCGCESTTTECKALSEQLMPPDVRF